MFVGRVGLAVLSLFLGSHSFQPVRNETSVSLTRFSPSPDEVRQAYDRTDKLPDLLKGKAFKLKITPHWYDKDRRFWYRNDLKDGAKEFIVVETTKGRRMAAFDQGRLAESLSKAASVNYASTKLPFSSIDFSDDLGTVFFNVGDARWKCDLKTYNCVQIGTAKAETPPPPVEANDESADLESSFYDPIKESQRRRGQNRELNSPDGNWLVELTAGNLSIQPKEGTKTTFTTKEGSVGHGYVSVSWSPDSKELVGVRIIPGDRKEVYLIESSPKEGGRAKLHSRVYDLPGDKLDTFDMVLIDPVKGTETKVDMEPIDTGDAPEIRWKKDNLHFTYEKTDRGHGRFRVIVVDALTGSTRPLVDDKAKTFIDITSQYVHYLKETDEIIWRSEQDGWGHLYLTDGEKGTLENQITKGNWVVRGVDKIDEKTRQIWFHASGKNEGQDPYLMHYYRVNFNGTGLTALTESNGNHTVQYSPTNQFLIDTYSRVDQEPIHELRRVSDGKLISTFEKADISELKATGWNYPEVFVAKGRDGTTDIYGFVCRPMHMDPNKKYPIIENIYAGPQDSFVPKSFSPFYRMQALAELGFIVIQVDGMGTRNRSKAFHDVCWKNLADAGFPDRILWMKSLALRYPYIDLDKVGVYGTSAGGQNSTGAVLFHPEFYKVAVSSCGCHDNRMDKVWWNEQWMGYPVGPHYAEQSNITNAANLKGRLLLMVGEMDTNVPPESTLRLVDALLKAKKDFDFLMLPGFDHTDGGPMGERKRRDFFVHNLLGVEPPERNSGN